MIILVSIIEPTTLTLPFVTFRRELKYLLLLCNVTSLLCGKVAMLNMQGVEARLLRIYGTPARTITAAFAVMWHVALDKRKKNSFWNISECRKALLERASVLR